MNRLFLITVLLTLAICQSSQVCNSQEKKADDDPLAQIKQATANLNRGQTYLLEYKFRKGQSFKYKSEHILTKTTSMASFTDKLSSRSQNVKVYKINNVDSLGQITFVHINEKSKTETRLNDKDPVIYDSESKEKPPQDYRQIAKTIGAVLFTYRIKPNGEIIERKSHFRDWDLGTGKAIVPFPKKPIPVGYTWFVGDVVTAKRADRRVVRINLRLRYRVESVSQGLAKISMKTEVLTPITPKLRSQILQDLIEGERIFDITNGRFVRSEIQWNHRVSGFEGSDSLTEYLGRYTESLVVNESKTSRTGPVARIAKQMEIKTIDCKPIMRRPR